MVNRHDYEYIIAESIEDYGEGGFFPIYLHDELNNGRYKIQNKLGAGSYSIIWLAFDQQCNTWVSVKGMRACDSENNTELSLLQQLKQAPQHPGKKHLPTLLNFFFEEKDGKNCLFIVTELLGPDVRTIRNGERLQDPRDLTAQLCQAISCLHSNGIVHADIYERNVLARLPAGWDPSSIRSRTDYVTRKDGAEIEPGLPDEIVLPIHQELWPKDLDYKEIVLIDLSSAFRHPECSPTSVEAAGHVIAPEMLFCQPLTFAVDIWKLACMSYFFVTFHHVLDDWSSGRTLLPVISQRLGDAASPWLLQSLFKVIHDGIWEGEPKSWFPDLEPPYPLLENDELTSDPKVISFIRKLLIADPKERPNIEEVLTEEYVGGYLHSVG